MAVAGDGFRSCMCWPVVAWYAYGVTLGDRADRRLFSGRSRWKMTLGFLWYMRCFFMLFSYFTLHTTVYGRYVAILLVRDTVHTHRLSNK